MSFTLSELVSLGERLEANAVLDWSRLVVRARAPRDPHALREVQAARFEVERLRPLDGESYRSAAVLERRQAVREAHEWRDEVASILPKAAASFGDDVRMLWSLSKVIRETRAALGAARAACLPRELVRRGMRLVRRLEGLARRLPEERAEVPAACVELDHAVGELYVRVRAMMRRSCGAWRDTTAGSQR